MAEDIKSKISELENELYSKDFKSHKVEDILSKEGVTPAPEWSVEKDYEAELAAQAVALKRHRIMKKFVLASIAFFAIAVSIAMFVWYRGANIISGENILIDIVRPVAVAGGDPFETKFVITNNNKVSIESATLLVEYPIGFYTVPGREGLPRMSKELGVVTPGQSVFESVNTMLYGEENTGKEVSVTLEYRMAGSNATLKKTSSYSINVSSSPVNIKLSVPGEVSSGQEVELLVDIASNSNESISSLLIDAVYPVGFIFESATPAPTYGTNAWSVPSLKPQEKRSIKIRGVIEGQESEEKVTKISVGTESEKDERILGIVYNSATESSIVTKPFLELDLSVNGIKTQQYSVVALNKGVRVDIAWQSNNPTKVSDVTIEVKLKSTILDKYSLFASGGGYYRSFDNTIVWNKVGSPELASVDSGERGAVSFSFTPISLGVDSGRFVKNPQIIFEVRARASRVSDVSASENISTFIVRSVKFETDIRVGAKGFYFSGPFQNSGPIPPQADRETTYTITLSAKNSSNNVSNTYAKTTLPVYVKWLNAIYPEGEDIAFNENTGEVTWFVGRIPAGGGRDASFQISLLPSVSHVNQSPALTGEISLIAVDDFTKTEVGDTNLPLTTFISSDPQFSPNDANVVN